MENQKTLYLSQRSIVTVINSLYKDVHNLEDIRDKKTINVEKEILNKHILHLKTIIKYFEAIEDL